MCCDKCAVRMDVLSVVLVRLHHLCWRSKSLFLVDHGHPSHPVMRSPPKQHPPLLLELARDSAIAVALLPTWKSWSLPAVLGCRHQSGRWMHLLLADQLLLVDQRELWILQGRCPLCGLHWMHLQALPYHPLRVRTFVANLLLLPETLCFSRHLSVCLSGCWQLCTKLLIEFSWKFYQRCIRGTGRTYKTFWNRAPQNPDLGFFEDSSTQRDQAFLHSLENWSDLPWYFYHIVSS